MRDIKTAVFEHLDAIAQQQGSLPSLRKIRLAIGGGSFSTISDAVKEWQKQSLIESGKLPSSFSETETKAIAESVWQVVLPIMMSRIQEISDYHAVRVDLSMKTSERLRQEALSMMEETEEQRTRLERKLAAAEDRSQKLRSENENLALLLASLRKENHELKRAIDEFRNNREELLQRLATAEAESALLKQLLPSTQSKQ